MVPIKTEHVCGIKWCQTEWKTRGHGDHHTHNTILNSWSPQFQFSM